ncbi:MAG: response regulator transcription factor [Candidatus Omnitrophica bacterium]|nr:response regulator transcription factor [Candidatus Omnitrophota bacterium]
MPQRVHIVEDDKDISRLIQYNLEKAGYVCAVSFSGKDALEALAKRPADLVILDVMMPGMDGFEVCRAIRGNDALKNIPVIMLTAKGEEVDRILGLELGADDYVVKPFSPRELILRVKAMLRRGKADVVKDGLVLAGALVMDPAAHRVTVAGRAVELARMEFKLLRILMERRGRVQSRDRLLNDVWGIGADVYTRTIDTHIRRLRKKLGVSGKLIETVIGLGYRFKNDED